MKSDEYKIPLRAILSKVALVLILCYSVACSDNRSEYEYEARERAVEAAKELIRSNRQDMSEMERVILKAKAVQSEYMLKGDTVAAQAFEASYKEYMQTNAPALAQELF